MSNNTIYKIIYCGEKGIGSFSNFSMEKGEFVLHFSFKFKIVK